MAAVTEGIVHVLCVQHPQLGSQVRGFDEECERDKTVLTNTSQDSKTNV